MALSLMEIEEEAGRLTEDERTRLIEFLIASLEPADEGDIKTAWEKEILARSDDIREGRVKPVPADEGLARARRIDAGVSCYTAWPQGRPR
jgi:putative addiction module component (TIGR02574 family)